MYKLQSFGVVLIVCQLLNFAYADFRKDALDLHNVYRSKHGSQPLVLSDKLNKAAQKWANQMASESRLYHSCDNDYGENVAYQSDTRDSDSEAVTDAITRWYNENANYNYQLGEALAPGKKIGHFTQVVWKDSKYLGVGVARSPKGVYVCANYDPPGNYDTEYVANVVRPIRK